MKIWFGAVCYVYENRWIYFFMVFHSFYRNLTNFSSNIPVNRLMHWINLRDKCVIEFQKFQIFGMHSHQFVFWFYFVFHYYFRNRRLESIIWFPLFLCMYLYLYTYCILSMLCVKWKGNGSGFFITFFFVFALCFYHSYMAKKSNRWSNRLAY